MMTNEQSAMTLSTSSCGLHAFRWNPYASALSTDPSTDNSSIGQDHSSSSDDHSQQKFCGPVPNVIRRTRRVRHVLTIEEICALISRLRVMEPEAMKIYLRGNPGEHNALLNSLAQDSQVRSAAAAQRGLVLVTIVQIAAENSLQRCQALLDVILSQVDLIAAMVRGKRALYALPTLYDLASRECKLKLHQRLIARFVELCKHPHGNYFVSHALGAFPQHQDQSLLQAATRIFADGSEFFSMCSDQFGVFVASAWAKVVPTHIAREVAFEWFHHPRARYNFFRISMSWAAHNALVDVLSNLLGTHDEPILSPLTVFLQGARYSRNVLRALRLA